MAPCTLFQLTTGPAVVKRCRTLGKEKLDLSIKFDVDLFANHGVWRSFCDVSHKDGHCRTGWNRLKRMKLNDNFQRLGTHSFGPLFKVRLWCRSLILRSWRHPSRGAPRHHAPRRHPLTKAHRRYCRPRRTWPVPGHLQKFRLKVLTHSLTGERYFYYISQFRGALQPRNDK